MMRDPIFFYSPAAFEPWDYRNPDLHGIGGSETSHIQMALHLACQGYRVVSFSPLPDDIPDRHFGGVHWCDLTDADFSEPGLWILYRCPEAVDHFDLHRADQIRWLVCQDEDYPQAWYITYAGEEAVYRRQDGLHRVLALCRQQMEMYQQKYPRMATKVHRSSNGLRADLVHAVLAEGLPRNPRRILYPSSPDRGLDAVLRIFERARERDPEMELWVAYGFDNINKIVAKIESTPPDQRDPQDVRWLGWVQQLKQRLQRPGIRHFGRMGQRELYRLWSQCGLWVYPCRFRETSCISSMEAQALGAIPIVCPVWAVAENVQHGVVIQDADAASQGGEVVGAVHPLTLARFVDAAVHLANQPVLQAEIRGEMMPWAVDHFDWKNVAQQWSEWIA